MGILTLHRIRKKKCIWEPENPVQSHYKLIRAIADLSPKSEATLTGPGLRHSLLDPGVQKHLLAKLNALLELKE